MATRSTRPSPGRGLGFSLDPRLAPARFAIFASAAVLGLSGAFLHQKGAPPALVGLAGQLRDFSFAPPRVAPPAAPFLGEGEDPDDEAALRAGLAPEPQAAKPSDALAAEQDPERDLAGLKEAVAAYKAGSLAAGDAAADAAKDPVVKATIEWVALRVFPREAGFARLQAFAAAHPDWPAQDWLRRRSEEALYGDRKGSALIRSFFSQSEPQTAVGKLALARALREANRTDEAAALVRSVWRGSDLSPGLETRLRADFGAYLEKSDHKYRADRFLYKEQVANAMRAATLAGPDVVALAKARAAVIAEAPSDKALAAVPAPLHADPGYKFAMIQKLRRSDKIAEAVAILLAAPRDPQLLVDGDQWWVERRLLARKLLDQGDPRTAYRLCDEHSALSREMRIEAEFHAGWIALRFLDDPVRAAAHFDTLIALAQTPMSQARAAYWRARAAEASRETGAARTAEAFYQRAAAHASTYYGQLARERIGLKPALLRMPADEATREARNDAVKALELLYAIGEKGLAAPLAAEAARNLGDPAQIAALARVVDHQRDANVSLTVGKLASQRGTTIDELAFPVYGVPAYQPLRNSAEPSIVYAIARQESAFNAGAVSSAGAKGLMQMIAPTARTTAQRAGVAFDETRLLADPAFNAQLGAAHLGDLLAENRGSYILTFAAYNAGGRRVKQWIDAYGDPRKPGVDPIDWIERIPFTETRNYVQRVSENLAVYRTRFSAPAAVQKADATP